MKMASSAVPSGERGASQSSGEFMLELVEPLLANGYCVWPLPKTSTRVGFTEGVLEGVHCRFIPVFADSKLSY